MHSTGHAPTIPPMALGRGITNRQASYLAALCRELGEPYCGSGMSRLEASLAISQRQDQVRAKSARRAVQSVSAQGPSARG